MIEVFWIGGGLNDKNKEYISQLTHHFIIYSNFSEAKIYIEKKNRGRMQID